MKGNRSVQIAHDEVELLLPWYVNGTLDEAEVRQVGEHLAVCADCRQALDELEMIASAVDRPSAVPIVPAADSRALLASLDQQSARSGRMRRALLAGSVAASIAVAALLFTLFGDGLRPAPAVYHTATSGTQNGAINYVLDVHFVAGLEHERREAVLRELNVTSNTPQDDTGTVRIVVALSAATMEQVEVFRADMLDRPEIRQVDLVAVQLPVER